MSFFLLVNERDWREGVDVLEGGALGGCQVDLFVVEDLGFRAYVQRIGSAAGKIL